MLKNKFEFKVNDDKDTLYSAELIENKYYISWIENDDLKTINHYKKEEIEELIEKGLWHLVIENELIYKTLYLINYKSPLVKDGYDNYKFVGYLENLNPNGLCAFKNKKEQWLLVEYGDILQMKPL